MAVNVPLFAASTVALFAVAASNALFAYELGGSFIVDGVPVDGVLLASASVALAIFQADRAAAAIRGDRTAWLFLAICLTYSLGAMASHVMQLQSDRARVDVSARVKYNDAKAERDRRRAELDAIGVARSVAEISAAEAIAPVPEAIRRRSGGCVDVTEAETRRMCGPLLDLRAERARADRRAEIEPKLTSAEAKLEKLEPPAERSAVGETVRAVLPWVFAIALEFLETFGFGLAFAAKPARPEAPRPARIFVEDNGTAAGPPVPPVKPVQPARALKGSAGAEGLYRLLDRIEAGTGIIPTAIVQPDGWISAGQSEIGGALGVSKTTVNNWLSHLVGAGRVQKRIDGRNVSLKIIRAPANNVVSLTA